jgi:hypothetical protein
MSTYAYGIAGSGSDTFTAEQLLAGDSPVVTQEATLASGENLAIHTIVGRDSTTGKLEVWDPAANDGTEVPVGILAYAVDASLADKACVIYVAGTFNFAQLVVPNGETLATVQAAFDRTPITIRELTYSVG